MNTLKLCQTREYAPQLLEHWLCTLQKDPRTQEWVLREKNGKIEILCTDNLEKHFKGSRSLPTPRLQLQAKFFVRQSKGPLLPIKRYSQFEDKLSKTRIIPSDLLLHELLQKPGSFIRFRFKAQAKGWQEKAAKRVKQSWFRPDRLWDLWESKAWFTWKLRNFLGPWLRKALSTSTPQKEGTQHMQSQHEREEAKTAILDKLARPLFQVQIEASHPLEPFTQGFSLPYLGTLSWSKKPNTCILSAEELASLCMLPSAKDNPELLQTENTAYLPPPSPKLTWTEEDRKRHLYLIGKTGMGKSSFLLELLKEDFASQKSIILIDPHQDLVDAALLALPPERKKDLILLDPSASTHPLAINPLEVLPHENAVLKASNLVELFSIIAQGSWGPRLEYILRNTLLTLMLLPNTTLLDLPRLLTGPPGPWLKQIQDLELRRFWEDEYFSQDLRTRQEYSAPILNKVGPLLTNPLLRNIFGQPKSKLHLDEWMDEGKIIFIPLARGHLGEDCSRLLGMIFLSLVQSALMRRILQNTAQRQTLALFVDEVQHFATPTFLSMLSESRKYGLALTCANQYLEQMPLPIQAALLGNVGSLISFRTGVEDAEKLAPHFDLDPKDLSQLAPFQCYVKQLQNNQLLPVFRWETAPQKHAKTMESMQILKSAEQKRRGRPRDTVEAKLKSRYTRLNAILT
jgi:hypothetical protein